MVGRSLVLAGLAALVLAGCSGGPPASADDTSGQDADAAGDGAPAAGGFAQVATSAGEGGVTGLIVDEAVRPIPGATVRLLQAEQEATTDEDGLFAFAGLGPGAYTLSADAFGYLAIAQTVTVDAEEVTKVKIVLLAAQAGTEPFHATYLFRGFIEASTGIAGFAVETAVEPYSNDTMCDCTFFFSVQEHPVDFIVEGVWQDVVPEDPSGLGLYWDFATAAGGNLTNGFSTNPLWHLVPGDLYPPDNLDYRVRLMGGWTWVAAQQAYDLYVTVFYREPPPEGWSLVKGDR